MPEEQEEKEGVVVEVPTLAEQTQHCSV